VSQPPRPTEQIYLPAPTVFPALVALGVAAVVVGLYAWWPYSVAGALIALVSLVAWLRRNRDEIAAMPNRQQLDSAPIPLRGR
jgi:membrane protein implicated in regulation of membrane protease activity